MMDPSHVIVIGGSAGALEALLLVLPALPGALIAPIVVAMHLSPNGPSLLPELLARVCRRPVREVEDKVPLEASVIYVAPPNYHVLIERDRVLSLSVDDLVHFSRPSIDVLFESAADSFGRNAVGIMLSGANEDGARGLARIVAAGGAAIIQDPASAPCPEMPASALRRVGSAAHVLALGAIASSLPALVGATPLHQDLRP